MPTTLLKCLVLLASLAAASAFAVNCQRAQTPVENTVCNSDNLRWLDSTLNLIYRNRLVKHDAQQVAEQYRAWERSLNNCTSDSCIERAYYEGISLLSDPVEDFDWGGTWWNSTAPNMSGGMLQLSRSAEWSVNADIRIWAGDNRDEYTAEARKIYRMALIEQMSDSSSCRVLMIPRRSGALQIYSNADWGCRMSMPGGGFIDGRYLRAARDPRPAMTLLTMGILPDAARDARFRELVGADYQQFVDTANVYLYQEDLDNIGASVIGMWLRGAANARNAIIMYTASDIWAARISPDARGKKQLHYYSTRGSDVRTMPRTLASWRMRYLDN